MVAQCVRRPMTLALADKDNTCSGTIIFSTKSAARDGHNTVLVISAHRSTNGMAHFKAMSKAEETWDCHRNRLYLITVDHDGAHAGRSPAAIACVRGPRRECDYALVTIPLKAFVKSEKNLDDWQHDGSINCKQCPKGVEGAVRKALATRKLHPSGCKSVRIATKR